MVPGTDHGSRGGLPRVLDVNDAVDPVEFCYDQRCTDGLPVVPPTPEKVAAAMVEPTRLHDGKISEGEVFLQETKALLDALG
jgi:hypothetical protein